MSRETGHTAPVAVCAKTTSTQYLETVYAYTCDTNAYGARYSAVAWHRRSQYTDSTRARQRRKVKAQRERTAHGTLRSESTTAKGIA